MKSLPYAAVILIVLALLTLPSWRGIGRSAAQPASEEPEILTFAGHLGGVVRAVAVQGTYAYVGEGAGLTVLDLSDPTRPTVVGKAAPLPDIVEDLAMVGDHVYIAAGQGGLRVVDVSNPASPNEVASHNTPGDAVGLAVAAGDGGRTYAYVADSEDLRVVDVSDLGNPTEVGVYAAPGTCWDVAVAEGEAGTTYAYVANHWHLRVVDVSDPSNPEEVGVYNTPGSAQDVAVMSSDPPGQTYAYVADGSYGLRVLDVSTPSSPDEVGFYDTPGDAVGVVVEARAPGSSYAYVADGESGLRVVDVSAPSTPNPVGSYDTPGSARGLTLAGDHAFVGDDNGGLRVVDVSSAFDPSEVSFYETPGTAQGVAVARSAAHPYAYLADGEDGLRVIDVLDPSSSREVGFYDAPGPAYDLVVADDYAYLATEEGLRVVDVFIPSSPSPSGFMETYGPANGVALGDDHAYVAEGYYPLYGLFVVDVSTPSNPRQVGTCDTPREAQAVAVGEGDPDGTYAYVADYLRHVESSLRVIDVSTPTQPSEVGRYALPGPAWDVAVDGTHVYVADGDMGLRVVDVSDPSDPQEIGACDTPGDARGVALSGDTAYLADGDGGLRVVDVSNPARPRETRFYDTPGNAQDVAVAAGYVYVADGEGGLIILFHSGAGPTPTPTPTGTSTPTATPTSTATPTNTPTSTPTPTATPGPKDDYEPDDICDQASPIATNGAVQVHTFHDYADKDWVSFDVISGTTYLIEAQVGPDSRANVLVELHDDCAGLPVDTQNHAFTPGVRLQFQAPASGVYYLRLSNHEADDFGSDVSYRLSVRALSDEPTPGALILVAGKLRSQDVLQDNIHQVTNAVYRLFRAHGYGADRINYLATDLTLDPDEDGQPDVEAEANRQNLAGAITDWAVDRVGPDRALTLYLTDHGGYDRFYLNGSSEMVSPSELDGWLDALEATVPGVKVNVVVEACHSGSFIAPSTGSGQGLATGSRRGLLQSVSGPGRVVIASTGAHAVAYASDDGAIFSDALLDALGRDMSLYGSFEEAKWAAQQTHPSQVAWLDDDGDGVPNEDDEGQEAQRRGFAYTGTFAGEQWPPYVAWARARDVADGQGVIEAEVRDDDSVSSVYAVVYKPSYQPPDPGETEELPQEDLPTVALLDFDGDDVYSGVYEGFDELGAYRIVVHARDDAELDGRPKEIDVTIGRTLYLPLVLR